jgi:GNAT superfamily N-acetyltransferase
MITLDPLPGRSTEKPFCHHALVSEIRIRPRQPEDLDRCVAALALVHAADEYPTVWPTDPARFLTPTSMLRGWVAVDEDDSVLGHILLSVDPDEPGTGHINRLFVAPAARGHKVGYRLLAQARAWAEAESLALELEVVASEQSAAIVLYENTGWQRVATVPADWSTGDGAVVMVHRYKL